MEARIPFPPRRTLDLDCGLGETSIRLALAGSDVAALGAGLIATVETWLEQGVPSRPNSAPPPSASSTSCPLLFSSFSARSRNSTGIEKRSLKVAMAVNLLHEPSAVWVPESSQTDSLFSTSNPVTFEGDDHTAAGSARV